MTDDLKQAFRQRVSQWAEKLNVGTHTVTLRPMRNKWASCSTSGRLTFNSELLALDADLWDYVIVHELLHFFVANHGKLWKSLMTAYLGDYPALEAKLRGVATENLARAR
ncbi:MAG: M48 family metallopeptidase [Aromatoleum sp.]|jgi:predicted metal-dependent hydrolase|uniref:M48 metallopeptidase family protein n=1 Tax=Aromatoleum sp. TaxID=2307007 RepID=UPI002894280A|nr:M48 family metallopeptidase [Aromatoleum sp.]MDT3669653.1 M48 family metallopeptidase [Aromatoleum sp.]